MQNAGGTYTITSGTTDYSYTALTPFSSDTAHTFWTSDSARTTSIYGYTYPEIWDWSQTPQQLTQNVTSQINAMYGSGSTPGHKRSTTGKLNGREWFLNVAVNQLAFEESFVVRVFDKEPLALAANWSSAPNLLGSVTVFVTPPEVRSARSITASTITVHGEVSLQAALEAAGIQGTNLAVATAYLKEHLVWKLQSVGCPTHPNYNRN